MQQHTTSQQDDRASTTSFFSVLFRTIKNDYTACEFYQEERLGDPPLFPWRRCTNSKIIEKMGGHSHVHWEKSCMQPKKKNSPRSFTAGVLINAAEEHACRSSRGMENSIYFFSFISWWSKKGSNVHVFTFGFVVTMMWNLWRVNEWQTVQLRKLQPTNKWKDRKTAIQLLDREFQNVFTRRRNAY